MIRIGIDVGGTNTDAVLMEGNKVLASNKSSTTEDIVTGITTTLSKVLEAYTIAPESIECVMIGTTHFTNAFVERKRLSEVGIIRIGLPAADGLPPLIDWPEDLLDAVGRNAYMVHGGYQIDGRQIAPLDEAAIVSIAKELREKNIQQIAISSIFAPVNREMEDRAAEIIKQEFPEAKITLSCEIGRLGLLERENAAVMNAALSDLSIHVVSAFAQALKTMHISAPFYVSQNDGTLMSAETVERFPVLTFASGPTNSMRGAAYLSGIDDAIVVDIGGTTADAGVLVSGFPRESSIAVDIGGVRTNFRMPDLICIGLGGGSIVHTEPKMSIGPESVGYKLGEKSLCFGGDTITTTDVVVAAGYVELGNARLVSHLSSDFVSAAIAVIREKVENTIDQLKTSADLLPVILVGGGSILIRGELEGVSEVHIPDNAGVANAIGAARAQVCGEIDSIFSYESESREVSLKKAKELAIERAIGAGARDGTVEIIDIEEVSLAYMPGGQHRVRIKAVGDLAMPAVLEVPHNG